VAARHCDSHGLVQRQTIPNPAQHFALPLLWCFAFEFGTAPIEHGLDEADRISPAEDQFISNRFKIVAHNAAPLNFILSMSW
jgi:hypothetical protein